MSDRTIPAPEPGIYPGVSFQTYCTWDAVNFSKLKHMAKSPADYRAASLADDEGDSKSLRLGRLTHDGKLEPDTVHDRYAVCPSFKDDPQNIKADGKRTTNVTNWSRKKTAEFEEQNKDKQIVTASEFADSVAMVNCIAANRRANECLSRKGRVELSIVWEDDATGVLCKGRIDHAVESMVDTLTELKTDKDCDPERFGWTMWQRLYHVQIAHYDDGWKTLTDDFEPDWNIVVVHNAKPFYSLCAPVDADTIEVGRIQRREWLEKVKACQQSGQWPGPNNPPSWKIPEKKAEMVLDQQVEVWNG